MKKAALFLVGIITLLFTSCSKEGVEGPAGPAGPAGDDGSFTVNTLTIAAADWAGSTYVEYVVDFINADIYEEGVAIAYIMDDYSFWNSIPSQWHDITGFSYKFDDSDGDGTADTGLVGFDALNNQPTTDITARVVTMTSRDYEVLSNNGLINNYHEVMTYLAKK